MEPQATHFDVIVVGGGHAGAEAAWAAANLGAAVALVTLDPSKIGVMSCNPAIGGLAKGQIVREIDALHGLMGLAADATGINFKMLNVSRGPAVRGPRTQCDKHAYADEVQRLLRTRPNIAVLPGAVDELLVEHGRITGALIAPPGAAPYTIHAPALVLTTGTFMRGLMHTGETKTPGGRAGEAAAVGISGALSSLGFELARLKTGTPPRLARESIAWEDLDAQHADAEPVPFSDLSERPVFPALPQVECRITSTSGAIHSLIRDNLHRAPMFSGQIESVGPRYCPSIEDKVVRFADRDSHHVFLEPESLRDNWVYCNGISTSLPADVQDRLIRLMPGCENAVILRHGYAVEYDMVRPHQIDATAMTKRVDGLFLAGQINGTSGYEEAAGQGVIAGLNAVRFAAKQEPVRFARDLAYLGVMLDDLVTKTPKEPYRMFTSRAEHRLLLRADNSADRLTPLARDLGLLPETSDRWRRFLVRRAALDAINRLIDTAKLEGGFLRDLIKRPEFTPDDLAPLARPVLSHGTPDSILRAALFTAHTERQYAGFIDRQQNEARRHAEMERKPLPSAIDYSAITSLRAEAREALSRFRPATLGQASRLEGVTPADLTILLVATRRAT
ncbi:MAG: tRNA uridine-5-carboxymethylaminomethyl(34) synthesis enzyme MnmG [Phycisphaerales bacterium]